MREVFARSLGLRRLVGGGEFTPADLFGESDVGVFYDPSQINTLFQTDDTSTPVTADGQTIGRMTDLSGNGNHAVQATASKRPLFKVTGGLNNILGDGTDDFFDLPDGIGVTGTQNRSMFWATSMPGVGKTVCNFGPNTNDQQYGFTKSGGNLKLGIWGASDTSSLSVETLAVLGCVMDGTTLGDNVCHRNLSTDALVGANTLATVDTMNKLMTNHAGLDVLEGALFGFFFIGRALDADEITLLKDYLAEKSGVTL